MTETDTITLFHSPNTRSTGALILLEELGAPYDLHVLKAPWSVPALDGILRRLLRAGGSGQGNEA